ncbi:MAG: hypothetical protein B6241_04770 [Spirochaetaceae bacterium 4572_59]|nr:MAG: hypothetical protein B6241_04770 [Spirochaetaceae bacterium 4572_59]
MKKILLLSFLFMVLFSCSEIADMQDRGQVRIIMDQPAQGSSRFLADNGSKVVIAFLVDSDVYLFEEYDEVSTTIDMNGIIAGDYVVLALLLDENDDMVGMASKDVSIEPGINYIDLTLGPGIWDLKLNNKTIDLTDMPSGYGLIVMEDSLVLDIPDSEINKDREVEFTVTFKTNAKTITVDAASGSLNLDLQDVDDYIEATLEASEGARSFVLEMTDPVNSKTFTYTISVE